MKKKKQRNRPKKSFLYGKRSVYERLKANPSSIHQIFITDKFSDKQILHLIEENNVSVKLVSEKEIQRIKRADRVQSVVARVDNFVYTELDDVLDAGYRLFFLEGITDPHNLGAIIRTLACFGNFAVVIGRHNSCLVNDTVMHVASGGENYVPVCAVNSLPMAILKARESGWSVYGAVIEDAKDISDIEFDKRPAIVLGSEGKGLSSSVKKAVDHRIKIPMKGASLSFNVSVACGIIAYAVVIVNKFS